MKKKIIILFSFLLSLAALAAEEGKNDTGGQSDSTVVKEEKRFEPQVYSDDKLSEYVKLDQIDSLKCQIEELKGDIEKKTSSGYSLFDMLISLLLGVAGGIGAFLFLEKRKSVEVQQEKEVENTPRNTPSSRRINDKENFRNPNDGSLRRESAMKSGGASSNLQQRAKSSRDSQNIARNTVAQSPREVVAEPSARREIRREDVRKIVFGNISIPTKDMLIVTENNLTDSESGKNFEFDLNETKGTGTYTFAPSVEAEILDRLSALEPFIEPFEFNSSVRKIEVKRPGTLVEKGGYWQVESKIVISLS
ncbi:MAG: hypothetical protein K2K81_03790 [Muribaculaceae bacterium]|nr:hypothetical protein [Muribaculaceae bacterium]